MVFTTPTVGTIGGPVPHVSPLPPIDFGPQVNEMKFAICHELYENCDWETQCGLIAEAGYTGIEVAPFTIGTDLIRLPESTYRRMQVVAQEHGLQVIGLHWMLAKTNGLYLTHPDAAIRRNTAEYLRFLARMCRQLGGSVMVFGSPAQRNLLPRVSTEEATRYACDVFSQAAAEFADQQVTLCLEPLTPKETNFMNTCAEAVAIIEQLDHPNIRLHQDVKAMLGAEKESIPFLIDHFKNFCRHFHVNDSNLLGPGMGETDFHPILKALQDSQYRGWVSVEVFDYKPGAQHIAVQSLKYMQRVLEDLQSL